jgi:putative FmdB family regulatory protein
MLDGRWIAAPCKQSSMRVRGYRACYTAVFKPKLEGTAVPLYEYKCVKCGKKTEKIETVSGPHLKKCPHCGGKVERLQSAPAIQFKGSGWYVTDYAGKSSAKDGATSDSSAAPDKKDSPAKESAAKETPSSKETKEKKSAGKK